MLKPQAATQSPADINLTLPQQEEEGARESLIELIKLAVRAVVLMKY